MPDRQFASIPDLPNSRSEILDGLGRYNVELNNNSLSPESKDTAKSGNFDWRIAGYTHLKT